MRRPVQGCHGQRSLRSKPVPWAFCPRVVQHREATFLARLSDPGSHAGIITAPGSDATLMDGSATSWVAQPAPYGAQARSRL